MTDSKMSEELSRAEALKVLGMLTEATRAIVDKQADDVIAVLRASPTIHEEAMKLALLSKDPTVPAAKRMLAYYDLGKMFDAVSGMIKTAKETKARGDAKHGPKAEFKWVNGAKVRIKQEEKS